AATPPLFPYTTLFRSGRQVLFDGRDQSEGRGLVVAPLGAETDADQMVTPPRAVVVVQSVLIARRDVRAPIAAVPAVAKSGQPSDRVVVVAAGVVAQGGRIERQTVFAELALDAEVQSQI